AGVKEYYQDFRNKRPLSGDFRLGGPDPDNEMKLEDEGLRITLAADRPQNWVAEVHPNVPLIGDFEFTATYELLSAQQPVKGYGVGVNLTIQDKQQRKIFAKVSRVNRPNVGSVYFAEHWPPYDARTRPSDAKSGQLRLTRVGETLYFLVSE